VGDAGILVPPGDSGALAEALRILLCNPVRAAELGRDGFRRVRERFTWENAARKTVEVYRRAIDANG
jgi:glycosyltransferase involved in cell wall biosynthesis